MTTQLTNDKLSEMGDQIILWIDNDRPYYDRKMLMFEKLAKKMDKGKYDHDRAGKMFNYLTTDVRRMLNKTERESMIDYFGTTLPTKASEYADADLVKEFEDWYANERS